MLVYHQVNPDVLESALKNGLKIDERGDKGDDKAIIAADKLLDDRCPHDLKDLGLSRQHNLYAYLSVNKSVVNITTGELVPVNEFVKLNSQVTLALSVDPKRCYVSDLVTYDAVKSAINNYAPQDKIDKLSRSYWDKIISLDKFKLHTVSRPEIMITYDIPPTNIQQITA